MTIHEKLTASAQDELKNALLENARRFREKERAPGFTPFPSIPVARFSDPGFYDLEYKYVWKKSWLYAGHVDELPEPGSVLRWSYIEGLPAVLVRGEDLTIRAFYNVCSHRGSALVLEDCAKLRGAAIVCPMHSWRYKLDGKLERALGGHGFDNIDNPSNDLKPLRCELLGNLIFINFDPEAKPLAEDVADLRKADPSLDLMIGSHFVWKQKQRVPGNWKQVAEAFLELYHVSTVHGRTVAAYYEQNAGFGVGYENGHSTLHNLAHTPSQEELQEVDTQVDFTCPIIYNANLFPNLASAGVNPFTFIFINTWPISVSESWLEIIVATSTDDRDPNSHFNRQLIGSGVPVVQQDVDLMKGHWEGMMSGAIKSIQISPEESNLFHHQEHIDRLIGSENIPEALRVPSRVPGSKK